MRELEKPSPEEIALSNINNGSQAFDFDASPPLNIIINPHFSLGVKLKLELEFENNKDLDDKKHDRLSFLESKLDLAALYQPTPDLDIFGETRFEYEKAFDDDGDQHSEITDLELREGYLLIRRFVADPLSLQIGRQRFKDDREWFFDERLDAIKLIYEKDDFSIELSASSKIIDPDKDEDKITHYILNATYKYRQKGKIALLGLIRQDRSDQDRDPIYLGLSWSDRSQQNQKFWLDTAGMFGQDGDNELQGFGLDAGWIYRFDGHLKPSITLGYALGSGDSDPSDDTDHAFQQTGLQDNKGGFNGNTKFQYYGEAFDPELSNMMVFTVGIGFATSKDFSLDVIYHYYLLHELSNKLRDADIDESLTGNDRDLGHEIDLIVGLKLDESARLSLRSGMFVPGAAFPENTTAYSMTLELQIIF